MEKNCMLFLLIRLPLCFAFIFGIFLLIYFLSAKNSNDYYGGAGYYSREENLWQEKIYNADRRHSSAANGISFDHILKDRKKNKFKFTGNDSIVFLHIQKTAGTSFERFMVKKLNISVPCLCNLDGRKRCECKTKNGKTWLFSRYSTGWVDWACGLHSDYTQLVASDCVNYYFEKKEGVKKARLFFTTFLREPVDRFISEYSHVERGATWKRSRHFCKGRSPTQEELPQCYNPEIGWKGVGFDEFVACPHNMAFNRQTRMLADLTLVDCYNQNSMDQRERERIMLASAMRNLRDFAFFGIKERMEESQFIFEKTFGLRFTGNLAEWNKSKSAHVVVGPKQMDQIKQKNGLDIALYTYALDLFQQRLAVLHWNSSAKLST